MDAVSEQRVRLRDGTEIRAAVSGTGPPAVLLHGGPGLWDYLGSLADLLTDAFTVIRFDQRGCGRSSPYDGPFTIEQAVDDLDRVRAALAARPASDRTPEQEREYCLLQWRPDYSPAGDPAVHALALWDTRPPGAVINLAANRQLRGDPTGADLLQAAARVTCPVTMICGADDPRPWSATDSLLAALPHASRVVFDGAGHVPWAERPADTRQAILGALNHGAAAH